MKSALIHEEESYQILGACFEVYKEKGHGFLEAVYQECLAIEFEVREIPFVEQPNLKLDYKGRELKQRYQPDLLCYNKIIVEIKAVKHIVDDHRAQAIDYLKATKKELCLLINFGHHPKTEHERFINQSLSSFP